MTEKAGVSAFETYFMISDEDVIERIHSGDTKAQDYIIHKYKRLVKLKAHSYFIKGGDKEDIVQEGMIGLYKAMRDYQKDKEATFYSFAELCITRQIISAIKAATRQKHIPLNNYVSLNKPINDEDSEKTYMDELAEKRISNPEELFIGQEEKDYIENSISEVLSSLECRVLSLYLQGKTYTEIGYLIDKDEKSIDNALQRVRRKVEKILAGKDKKFDL